MAAICPKCWKRDPQNVGRCDMCDEIGCANCLDFANHCKGCAELCDEQAIEDEPGPTCPSCGHADGFREIEYETESGSEMCLTCNACGAKTDDAELSAMEN